MGGVRPHVAQGRRDDAGDIRAFGFGCSEQSITCNFKFTSFALAFLETHNILRRLYMHRIRNEMLLTGLGVPEKRADITDQLREDEHRYAEHGWIDSTTRGTAEQPAALAGAEVPTVYDGAVEEIMPDFGLYDQDGYIWGRPGHYPLWVMLGANRLQSSEGARLKEFKNSKIAEWKATGVWPWWRYHESESWYWLPGHSSTGRGFSGLICRSCRSHSLSLACVRPLDIPAIVGI